MTDAQTYFQNILNTAGEQTPVRGDAQAGLAYIAALRITAGQGEPNNAVHETMSLADVVRAWQEISRHPAATHETQARITRIAAEFGMALALPSDPTAPHEL